MNQFYQTRNMYREFTNYTAPLSFEEWDSLPEDDKAAVLFCQFFDQITLAWEKTKSTYSNEDDGISEVTQYLIKNVSKIHEDPKRFTPAYIYRVAYNCLYCLCRDDNRYKRAYHNEISNIQSVGDDELDLFDLLTSEINVLDEVYSRRSESVKMNFWAMIENMDISDQVIIARLLEDPTCLKIKNGKARQFTASQLSQVTSEQIEEMKWYLADKLDEYREAFEV